MDPGAQGALFKIVRRVSRRPRGALVCAHRGDLQSAPENTLAAFEAAMRCGSDLIELDIRTSADGELVVFHDGRLERTTNGRGELSAQPLEALRALDAGSWYDPVFQGERIPTMSETLDLVKGRVVPMIEIKERLSRSPNLAEDLVSILRERDMLEEVIVLMREKARVLQFRALAPELALAFLSYTAFQARSMIRSGLVDGLDQYWKSLSPRLVHEVRQAGMFLTPWTINRRIDMQRCLDIGCDCLITDCPLSLRDLLDEREMSLAARGESSGDSASDALSEVELEPRAAEGLEELEGYDALSPEELP